MLELLTTTPGREVVVALDRNPELQHTAVADDEGVVRKDGHPFAASAYSIVGEPPDGE